MAENNRFLSLLGLARRAGVLAVGQDKVEAVCKGREKQLVFVACDISENVLRMLNRAIEQETAKIYKTETDRYTLGAALGVKAAQIVAVELKSSFAKKILNLKGSGADE